MKDQSQNCKGFVDIKLCDKNSHHLWQVEEAKDRVDASRFSRYQVYKADPKFLEEEFSLLSRYEII